MKNETAIRIDLNGSEREVPEGITVSDLLRRLELLERGLAVELNRQILPRSEYASRRLCAGDRIEIVTFVGGG